MTPLQRIFYFLGYGRFRWFRRWVGARWIEREWHTCGSPHYYGMDPCSMGHRWVYEPKFVPDSHFRTEENWDVLATARANLWRPRKYLRKTSFSASGMGPPPRLTEHDERKAKAKGSEG